MPLARNMLWMLLGSLLMVQWPAPAYSAPSGFSDPQGMLAQFRVDHWTTEDGLPVLGVDHVLQTRDGYIWLATQEGLARFDGLKFTVFKKNNSGLGSNNIYSMFEATDGALWIGTRAGGLSRYKDFEFTTYGAEDGLPTGNVSAVTDEADGTVWVGFADGSLFRFRDGEFVPLEEEVGVSLRGVQTLLRDHAGDVWIGTREDGLFRYHKGILTAFKSSGVLPLSYITDLSEGPNGVWVASASEGIAYIDGFKVTRYRKSEGLVSDEIASVRADGDAVWIGTEGDGLVRLREGHFEHLNGATNGSSRKINDLIVDREGSLWMATMDGLKRMRHGRFVTLGIADGLPSEQIYPVMESRDGAIWSGSERGLAKLQNGQVTRVPTRATDILSLAETPDGSIWVGSVSGLYRIHGSREQHFTTADGLASEGIYALLSGANGLWIGTSGGVTRFADGAFTHFTKADGLTSNFITTLHESSDGDLWVGTYDGGLNRIRDGRVTSSYGLADGLRSLFVTALFEGDDGTIWFSVREGGLYRLRDGVLHGFTTGDGLHSDTILSILADDAGYLWLTSNAGLSRVRVSDLVSFTRGQLARLSPDIYTEKDGLRTAEFNGGFQPAGWRATDGRLWYPSTHGLVGVDPYRQNDTPPKVVIEQLLVADHPISLAGIIQIRPGEHRFEIDYAGLSFVAPAKTEYYYRLDGVDKDWVYAGHRRQAFFTNLSPGTYVFHVKARNADGVWSDEVATLRFERLPFFWETGWFVALCLLVVIGIAILGYRLRINQMKARAEALERIVDERTRDLRDEKERTEEALCATEEARVVIEEQAEKLREMDRIKMRFFNNISHEFRTPLTLNIGPMENALLGVYGTLSTEMRRQVEVMLRNSRRLLRLINQLLDLSKLESGRMKLRVREACLTDLVEGIVLSFTPFAEKKNLNLHFQQHGTVEEFHFDPQNLEKVFFNLLSNAVKFTPERGDISVSMEAASITRDGKTSDAVAVTVRDSGTGIPAAEIDHIFDRFHQVDGAVSTVQEGTGIGLSLVKELVDLHGGDIKVTSSVGQGTSFRIVLPTDLHWLSEYEVGAADDIAEAPSRGPLVEMAVFDGEADESLTDGEVDSDRPLVLVVDDSPDVRDYVAGCIRMKYRVITARDGADGLEKARELSPDLVVSDVMMPRMNGYELCRALKSDDRLQHTPVVLVTSKASTDDKIEGLESGADDYVAKPFSARELLARVENLLHMRDQQRNLLSLNDDLVDTNVALREASEMKSQLLNIASHDMKNPLTAIREFARIIKEEVSGESHLLELLDLIYDSSNEMLSLITQLLDSSALESGHIEMKRDQVDLSGLSERVVQRNRRVAERKGQSLALSTNGDPDCVTTADPERILEAMDNLLSNAIKYSPHHANIFVSTHATADEVVYSVRDEGPGLTDDDMALAFGKFQKLSARPTGGETSTGLGLSIVKQIAELHQGRTWAESVLGEGSTFSFALPRIKAQRNDRPATAPAETRRADGKAKTPGRTS